MINKSSEAKFEEINYDKNRGKSRAKFEKIN
jgi:hypothetical protein